MQRDIQPKARSLHPILFYLHLHPPAMNQKSLRTEQSGKCKWSATDQVRRIGRKLLKKRAHSLSPKGLATRRLAACVPIN
jgi:hypothetical protein